MVDLKENDRVYRFGQKGEGNNEFLQVFAFCNMKSDSILGVYDAYKHELREINLDKVKRGEMNFPVVFKDTLSSIKLSPTKYDAYLGLGFYESNMLSLTDNSIGSKFFFEYPYKESYGNGLSATFCFVKDGSVNQQTVRMTKRLPDKTLTMKWEVFRDKLRPGQEEEWKLTVKTPQGMPAAAEMLATMYDASLDKIWKNNQSLRIGYNLSVPGTRWMDGYWGMNSYNYWFPSKSLKVDPMAYDHFVLPFNYVSNLVFEEEMIPLCNYRQNATVVGLSLIHI